jgi:hypothetical protein
MDAADNQKPPEATGVFPDKQEVGGNCIDHRFIMERQRDLDRAKRYDQGAHQHPCNWQIIEDAGNVGEISKQKRQPDNQHAHRNDNPSPF